MAPSVAAQPGAVDATRRLGLDLLQSRSHVNNAPLLISILSSACNSGSTGAVSSPKCLLEAMTSLQAFFLPLLRAGELCPASRKLARVGFDAEVDKVRKGRRRKEEKNSTGEGGLESGLGSVEAQTIYTRWLWEKYKDFTKILLKMLSSGQVQLKVQVAALHACMELVRTEGSGFSNQFYFKLCATLLGSEALSTEILGVLESEYFKFVDVSFFTYSNLEKLAASRRRDNPISSEDEEEAGDDPHTFVSNMFEMLSHLPALSEDGFEGANELWCKPATADGKLSKSKPQSASSQTDGSEQTVVAWKDVKKQRVAFSRAWIAFLQLDLPIDIYKKVLALLHKRVIPHLTNPLLLSDFLTNSYNVGGLISVMALNGLFILITKYGLEYHDFYTKLYALLEPSIFVAKYRARFFELLDTCLKSSHLPAYLAAAFAKKLGRLGITASPAGGLLVIAMIHNLLRRHPSINCLVHRDGYAQEDHPAEKDATGNDVNELDGDIAISNTATSGDHLEVRRGADPFRAFEPELAKCNALRSSLWEIETLRRHYCPAVSRFVASLETDLTVRAKTTEVAIKDFSSGSYSTIFSEEVGRRLKQVPLAFYQTVPTTLFPLPTALGDQFCGWKFGSSSVLQEQSHAKQAVDSSAHQLPVKEKSTVADASLGPADGSHESRENGLTRRPSKKRK